MNKQKLLLVNWFNHYEDEHLIHDYTKLEKLMEEMGDDIQNLTDNSRFAVFSYNSDHHERMQKEVGDLFDPEFYDDIEQWKSEYFEWDEEDPTEWSNDDFIHEVFYQKELQAIGKQAGNDEGEFDRLWTQRFVFHDEHCLVF